MLDSRTGRRLVIALAAGVLAACGSGGGSQGIQRGPSSAALTARIAVPPDTVIQRAWEVLWSDGVMARSFQRAAGDTVNVAQMESDWIYVPRVLPSAIFGHLTEEEKWIKLLFWARPSRGATILYIEALYSPASEPTEPVQWARMTPIPRVHPAWQYVDVVVNNLSRRLDDDGG